MARPSQLKEKRIELIPLVARAFAELGYRRTTTAELARRCGVRENILYRLWPDKRAMFVAAIEHVFESSLRTWRRLLETPGPGTAAERLLAYEATHHGEFGLYRILFAGWGEDDDPLIGAALRRTYRGFQRFLAEQIGAHQTARKSGGLPPELAAWAFVGLGTAANLSNELKLLPAGGRARLLAEVGRMLLKG